MTTVFCSLSRATTDLEPRRHADQSQSLDHRVAASRGTLAA
jgi:hypothetical protein